MFRGLPYDGNDHSNTAHKHSALMYIIYLSSLYAGVSNGNVEEMELTLKAAPFSYVYSDGEQSHTYTYCK